MGPGAPFSFPSFWLPNIYALPAWTDWAAVPFPCFRSAPREPQRKLYTMRHPVMGPATPVTPLIQRSYPYFLVRRTGFFEATRKRSLDPPPFPSDRRAPLPFEIEFLPIISSFSRLPVDNHHILSLPPSLFHPPLLFFLYPSVM